MQTKMKHIKWHIFISLVQIMNLVFATCRPVSVSVPIPHPSVFLGKDNRAFHLHHKILSPEEDNKNKKMIEVKKMIGSRPPSCANKCFGCMPCEAIQVPTTSNSGNVGVQYANYLPEGWKCKCGPILYTP